MFDKEQWVVIADTEERKYADVISNAVYVAPERGREYVVHIRVPSGLFTYLKEVMKISEEDMREYPLSFYLQEDNEVWYFGTEQRNISIDLWRYRSLPAWGNKRN